MSVKNRTLYYWNSGIWNDRRDMKNQEKNTGERNHKINHDERRSRKKSRKFCKKPLLKLKIKACIKWTPKGIFKFNEKYRSNNK